MSGRITIKPPLRKAPTISVPSRSSSRRGSSIRIPATRQRSPSESPISSPAPEVEAEAEGSEPAEEDDAELDINDAEPVEDDDIRMDVDVTVDDRDAERASSSARTLDAPPSSSTGALTPEVEIEASASAEVEADTPVVPRGRGRPRGRPRGSRGRGGGRGRGAGRGGARMRKNNDDDDDDDNTGAAEEEKPKERTRTVNGRTYIVDGDELEIDDDPKGETKIDRDGKLLGDRVFKAQTFQLPTRHPSKHYMLAIDAARTSGYRDSLYYFRRNPLAFKLNATQPEKDDLIAAGKLGGHLRTRAVTLITARSAYKLHGAKTVVDGRWVVDDYYEDRAREEAETKGVQPGELVGELADPRAPKQNAPATADNDDREREQRERTGEWGMYRPGGPTTLFGSAGFGPFSEGPLSAPKKAFYTREGVDEKNWMYEAARRAREADADWKRSRMMGLKVCGGVYDNKEGVDVEALSKRFPSGQYEPHTFTVAYRSDSQPTRATWQRLPDSEEKRAMLGGSKAGKNGWGLAWVDSVMEYPTEEERQTWQPIVPL